AALAAAVGGYRAFRTPNTPSPPPPDGVQGNPPAPAQSTPAPVAKENLVEVGAPVGAVAVSADGKLLSGGLVDPLHTIARVKPFGLRTRAQLSHDGENPACGSVAFAPDGRFVAGTLAGMRGFVVRELRDGTPINGPSYVREDKLGGEARALAFSPDSKLLAV